MNLRKQPELYPRLERDFAHKDLQSSPDDDKLRELIPELHIRSKLSEWHDLIFAMHEKYRIGIVTAIPIEFAAMESMLDEVMEYPRIPSDPNKYVVGTIPVHSSGESAENHVVITLLAKMGNNSAASAATNLLRSFPNVKNVIMVGIAGGIPNPSNPTKHVRLGDIVVSRDRGVVQYDMIKMESKCIELRDASAPPSAHMINQVNTLETRRLKGGYPWECYIKRAHRIEGVARPDQTQDILYDTMDQNREIDHPNDPNRREGEPKIFYGLIGSANRLLKSPESRDLLRDEYGVLAIEMEGSGIADGTWIHGANYILIRGICDYCDNHKNDLWQGYAATTAAAYVRSLLACQLH